MPQSLSYAQPLFLEEQPAAIALGSFAIFAKIFAFAYLVFCTVLVAKTYSRMPPHVVVIVLFGMSFTCLAVFVSLYSSAITVVESAHIQIRIVVAGRFSLFRRTIPVSQLVSVDITDMSGERKLLSIIPGSVHFMTRKRCVRLKLPGYREVVIGSQRADELLQAVQQVMTGSGEG